MNIIKKKGSYIALTILLSSQCLMPKTLLEADFSDNEIDVMHDALEEHNKITSQKNKSVIKKEKGLTRESGQSINQSGMSDVINLSPGFNPRNFLHVTGNDIKVELDGKMRLDSNFGKNTQYLNNQNDHLDWSYTPMKSTFDLGFGISYGELKYDRDVLEIGIDLRNRSTWGKPDEVAITSKTFIKDGDYIFGEHGHSIGVPMIYVRGFDVTFEPGLLFSKNSTDAHHIKCGFFPFEIGRGISLGAAYAVTPDFITYNPGDVIQEFAPGILMYGQLGCRKYVDYKLYLGIMKNLTGSFKDVNEPIRTHEYGHLFKPQRDFGVANIIGAYQLDLKIPLRNENHKLIFSPYSIFSHEGEEVVDFIGDARTNLATFGLNMVSEAGPLEFNAEFAQNYGSQVVNGIDRNSINREQRIISIADSGNPDIKNSYSIVTNSHINFMSQSSGTDINGKNAAFLGGTSDRQLAIINCRPGIDQNGKQFNYIQKNIDNTTSTIVLQNTNDRYRDAYINNLRGWMFVSDVSYKFNISDTKIKVSAAAGIASGDENPNKSLLAANDFAQNTTYEGFIGIQEVYTGKAVKSVFMLSGAGKVPRILSIPALESEEATSKSLGFPSKISRFTNLIYSGASCDINFDTNMYGWKLNPNILFYFQETQPIIYDVSIQQLIGTSHIRSYLGWEANLFLEMMSRTIEGLKIFATGTVFIPGSYYTDLKGIPLDKKQQAYINGKSSPVLNVEKTCLLGDNTAFFINIGMEYKF